MRIKRSRKLVELKTLSVGDHFVYGSSSIHVLLSKDPCYALGLISGTYLASEEALVEPAELTLGGNDLSFTPTNASYVTIKENRIYTQIRSAPMQRALGGRYYEWGSGKVLQELVGGRPYEVLHLSP